MLVPHARDHTAGRPHLDPVRIISLHVGSFLTNLGAEAHMGAAMVLAVVREEAPVATAPLIAGVGGSAMCADLGSRRIREEIDALAVLGIDVIQRVVMPRILAATFVALLLDAVVSIAGIAGGWYFSVWCSTALRRPTSPRSTSSPSFGTCSWP